MISEKQKSAKGEVVLVLRLPATVNAATIARMKMELSDALKRAVVRVVVSVEGVEWFDVMLFEALVTWGHKLRQYRGDLVVSGADTKFRLTRELLGYLWVLRLFPSVEFALRHFGEPLPVSDVP